MFVFKDFPKVVGGGWDVKKTIKYLPIIINFSKKGGMRGLGGWKIVPKITDFPFQNKYRASKMAQVGFSAKTVRNN